MTEISKQAKPTKKVKRKKTLKTRHIIFYAIFYPLVWLYIRLKYDCKLDKVPDCRKRRYLVLHNHQMPSDELFISLMLKNRMSFVATEDLFSNGFTSKLLNFIFSMIPIDKTSTDFGAIRKCVAAAHEGAHIVIAPEGNRTYSGRTEYIKPSIVGLARLLKLPILLLRSDGGFGVQPRFADKPRKGKIRVRVSRIIEREEYETMSDDVLYAAICGAIDTNEGLPGESYPGKHLAEYMERAIYVCPTCGLSTFESEGNFATCKRCGKRVEFRADKSLVGCGFDFPFRGFSEWYAYQCDFITSLDLSALGSEALYTDTVRLFSVCLYRAKNLIDANAAVSLYADHIRFVAAGKTTDVPFTDVHQMAVLGRNKININTEEGIFQLRGDKRFNPLKYINFCYHFKGMKKEGTDAEFLGL